MKSMFFAWTFACFTLAFGQPQTDVSGEWRGTLSSQKKVFKVELHIKQKGNQLTAVFYQKTLKGKDSLKATYSGHFKDGFVRLVPQNIEYFTGAQCAANLTLEMKGADKLTGMWKGDWKLTTCAPGAAGPMNLFRKSSATIPQANDAAAAVNPVNNETNEMSACVQQKRAYIAANDYRIEGRDFIYHRRMD